MNKECFVDILTALYNGNRGQAQCEAENILYDISIEDEYKKAQNNRKQYELKRKMIIKKHLRCT